MRTLIYLIVFVSISSCVQEKQSLLGDTEFQKTINAEYKDATTSPLKDKDRKAFRGLDFFEFDSVYRVKAHIKKTPNSEFFAMKTTTSRVSQERVYGVLSFIIKDKTYQLNVYKAKEAEDGYEDYLFLPFLDHTNGDTSYGGGRYIDLRIQEGDTMVIDFNKAYNPYCAYNEKYSCPIVPRENYLDVKIEAGVKKFNKH